MVIHRGHTILVHMVLQGVCVHLIQWSIQGFIDHCSVQLIFIHHVSIQFHLSVSHVIVGVITIIAICINLLILGLITCNRKRGGGDIMLMLSSFDRSFYVVQ